MSTLEIFFIFILLSFLTNLFAKLTFFVCQLQRSACVCVARETHLELDGATALKSRQHRMN